MNMRFMKRRKDAINNKSSNENETKDNDKKKRKLKPHPSSPRHYGHQQNDTKLNDISKNNSPRDLKTQHDTDKVLGMDVDDDGDNYDDDDHHHHENQLDNNNVLLSDGYYQATSVDMYGIGASLIGRRSFRGFNPAIERIWKDSKESLTSCNLEKNHRS